ncbi:MAG TPA: VanZ family protein [Burkholderiales bacterium]|nr:VanZ family protein [Burkholderiales bacterium]
MRFPSAVRLTSLVVALALIANLFISAARPEVAWLVPEPLDKVAHLTYFLVLAMLMTIADAGHRPLLVAVALIAVGVADEWHQAYVTGRDSSVADLVADCIGIAIGMITTRRFLPARA